MATIVAVYFSGKPFQLTFAIKGATMKHPNLIFPLFLAIATLVSQASIETECHDGGGGYLTQGFKAFQPDASSVVFEVERYSPVPEIVPGAGLDTGTYLAKRLEVKFPLNACHVKSTTLPQISLFLCSTGISKIPATLELLDGTQKAITLSDNSVFEAYQVNTETISAASTSQRYVVKMGLGDGFGGPKSNGVGFHVHQCR